MNPESDLGYGWLLEGERARLRPLRDITMMMMIDTITDKAEWMNKIQDQDIREKWSEELREAKIDISDSMIKRVFDELLYHAATMREAEFPIDPSFVGIYKSDCAIPDAVKEALKTQVSKLEDVSEKAKDWHPLSDQKVLDLVHPSLFPLIIGRTKKIADELVDGLDIVKEAGGGDVIDGSDPLLGLPMKLESPSDSEFGPNPYSSRYQWLPADVKISFEGDTLRTRFESPINNLHPEKHRLLYRAIESVLSRCVPLWDRVLEDTRKDFSQPTEDQDGVTSLRCSKIDPQNWYEECPSELHDEQEEAWYDNRVPDQPEAAEFVPPPTPPIYNILSSLKLFQVIVKLANIELGPGKEIYGGGTWHVEGQLNERIRASAIYYYDEHNTTASKLAFRQSCEGLERYDQSDHNGIEEIFGIQDSEPAVQELGSIFTWENRLLAFSNMMQHAVHPFKLIDKSKRGWRKILAFFLVDPTMHIISTARVPPQQRDWWASMIREVKPFSNLPREVFDLIISFVDYPLSLESAKEERLALMKERSA